MLMHKRSEQLEVIRYSDSDFAKCLDLRKSTFGCFFLLANRAFSWKSAKESIIISSTIEAEFVPCFKATTLRFMAAKLYFRTWGYQHYCQTIENLL